MGPGNPTISRETETQVPAACQPQPRQPHSFKGQILLTKAGTSLMGFPHSSDGKESTSNVETWVQSLGWEDPLEKGKAIHSSILAWRTLWTV